MLLKSVYVLVRMFCGERVVLQEIQGKWFTCQLGFIPTPVCIYLNFGMKKNSMLFSLLSFYCFFVAFHVLLLSKPLGTFCFVFAV